jgi:hypothetical protein
MAHRLYLPQGQTRIANAGARQALPDIVLKTSPEIA